MTRKQYRSVLPAPVEAVWAFHRSAEVLRDLTPPGQHVEPVGDLEVRDGALHTLRIRRFGLPMVWKARISEVEPPRRFVDTAEQSPFAYWRHEHRFEPCAEGTELIDTIEYRLPFGLLGQLIDRLAISRDIDRMFAHRHAVTRRAVSAER